MTSKRQAVTHASYRHRPWGLAPIALLLTGLFLLQAACSANDDEVPAQFGPEDGSAEAQEAASDSPEEASELDASEPDADGSMPQEADASEEEPQDSAPPDQSSPCPQDMVLVQSVCMDRFEAPNQDGAYPLVMFTMIEAEDWCQARDKRLCFDDEWTRGCAGAENASYPYGNTHQTGACNDDKLWRAYDQSKLNEWPWDACKPDITSLDMLFQRVQGQSTAAAEAAEHVAWLYQADPSGQRTECVSAEGVYDLCGNVEEWTRRREGGAGQFHGSLKGRYWAEPRTCQSAVTNHGDGFRFYEIGFRCCKEPVF